MLIGRKAERATLQALADGAARGSGGALLVTGEPGMGKTVLLDDADGGPDAMSPLLRASGPGVRRRSSVRRARRAPATGRARDRLASRAAGAGATRRLGLEKAAGASTVSPSVSRPSAFSPLLRCGRPVLAVVDDLQWVDEPSRRRSAFVARRVSGLHIALLCAAREGELPEPSERSASPRARRPARAGCGRAARPAPRACRSTAAVRRRLLELSAGNPLALVELPTALSDAQLQGIDPLGEPIPVNGGIERTFGARVARLPERTRQALLLAAAAGRTPRRVARASLRGTGSSSTTWSRRSSTGSCVHGRDASRSATRSSAPSSTRARARGSRRAAHALLAEVERTPIAAAWHRAAAAVAPDESLRRPSSTPPPVARSRGALPAPRLAHSTPRHGSPADDEARGKRLALAARAAHRAGDVAGAGRYAAAARELASDPITLADLLLVESDLRMREGDLEEPTARSPSTRSVCVETDRRRAATMLLLAAKLRIYRLEARAAVDEVERALAILPAGEHDLVHLVALSMSRTVAGSDGARDAALAAAAAAAKAPHGHAHTLGIAWPLIWLEEYDVAREATDRAIALQREAGFLLYLPQSLLPQAELDFRTGRLGAGDLGGDRGARAVRGDAAAERGGIGGGGARSDGGGRGDAGAVPGARAARTRERRRVRPAQLCRPRARALGLLALGSRRPQDAIAPLETAERISMLGGVGEPWLLLSAPDLVEALAQPATRLVRARCWSDFEERVERARTGLRAGGRGAVRRDPRR